MNEQPHGTPLLSVKPAAYHLIIPLVCGPPMIIGGTGILFGLPGHRVVGALLAVFGLGLTVMGIQSAQQKITLFEVTERGIMIYAKPRAIDVSSSLLQDLFIPWDRLERMRFLDLKQVHAERLGLALGGGWGLVSQGCIGLKLRTDSTWPPTGTLRHGSIMRHAKPGEIYLRTAECSPTGRKLWSAMAGLVRKYAGPDVVADDSTPQA